MIKLSLDYKNENLKKLSIEFLEEIDKNNEGIKLEVAVKKFSTYLRKIKNLITIEESENLPDHIDEENFKIFYGVVINVIKNTPELDSFIDKFDSLVGDINFLKFKVEISNKFLIRCLYQLKYEELKLLEKNKQTQTKFFCDLNIMFFDSINQLKAADSQVNKNLLKKKGKQIKKSKKNLN